MSSVVIGKPTPVFRPIPKQANLSPTPLPSVTLTFTPIPSITPIPTVIKIPTKISSPAPSHITSASESPTPTVYTSVTIKTINIPDSTDDIGLKLMKQINEFRAGKNLTPLSTDGYTCAFAVMRANEITNGFSHDGFNNRINSHTLPYPSYHEVAENIAMNSDSNSVIQGWIDSPGHNVNMSRDLPYACVGKSGNYYTFESWKP